jgi:cell division protein FtsZ
MPVVDEAATRIREEVDEDANIIVGFTFDESLEDRPRLGGGDWHR